MDVEKVFHMTGGVGDTSYSKNSSLQKRASDMVKHITLETLQQAYLTCPPKSFGIADLGCSSGQNTLSIVKEMIQTIDQTSRKILGIPTPELRIYLNDLPTNDFNAIFKALPDFHRDLRKERDEECCSIYIAAYPGSFYGRLFPDKSLHFVYSSYSLHWLSKVPLGMYDEEGKSINKGNVYISKSSPAEVTEAYVKQFQDDFSLFLRSRSEELVTGGQMVLILLGRSSPNHVDRGNSFLWEILSRSFAALVSQGEIEEEKVNAYEVHFYAPSKDEIEEAARREGSFKMETFEMFEIEKDVGGCISYGTAVATTVRAIQESMISHHFGEGILGSLFDEYGKLVDEEMAIEKIRPTTFLVVLRKL